MALDLRVDRWLKDDLLSATVITHGNHKGYVNAKRVQLLENIWIENGIGLFGSERKVTAGLPRARTRHLPLIR